MSWTKKTESYTDSHFEHVWVSIDGEKLLKSGESHFRPKLDRNDDYNVENQIIK